MASLADFNARETPPSVGFDVLPAGDYLACIESSEMIDKSADGQRKIGIKLVWLILEGDKKGRKLFQWVNYIHPSADCQRMSRAELSAICHACHKVDAKDTTELHNIPIVIKVGVQKGRDSGELENRIKKWTARGAAAAAQPAAAGAGAAPWQR